MGVQAKRRGRLLPGLLGSVGGLLAAATAMAESGRWQTNMPQGVTAVGQDIYGLHMLIFWICVVIGVGVFAWMFYSVYAYRKSRGAKAAHFHENTTVEILWTVIPFIILVAMAFPATKTMIDYYDTSDADLDVLITGYQWKWSYEYLSENGENVKFFSNLASSQDQIYGREAKGENYLLEVDNPLVLPVGKKVRLLVTANDVIHSWWVPDFAVKKDAIPGFVNEAQARPMKEGVYRGQCAELCGKDHGFMPIVVQVTSEQEFNTWMAAKQAEAVEIKALMEQQFSLPELVARGEQVYQRSCVACHGGSGEGGVGKAIAGSAIATGPVAAHLDMVVNGSKANPAMQAFGAQLNDLDLAAVVTYQRNAFGNNMGDSVQAVDVYNFKKGQ